LTLAQAAEKGGRVDEAADAYLQVPPGTKRYREARVIAARLLLEADRPKETLEIIAPFLSEPDSEGEIRRIGLVAAEKTKESEAALGYIDALLADLPDGMDEGDLLLRKAGHLEALDRVKESSETLLEVTRSGPPSAEIAQAAFAKMQQAFHGGDWAGVLDWAEAAQAGENPREALFYQAEALWELGRKGEAKPVYEELALEQDNRAGGAAVRLGMLAEESNDPSEALLWFRVALDRPTPDAAADYAYERVRALEAAQPQEKQQ
jgi:tetratricopeptide (TPR) repeat protein